MPRHHMSRFLLVTSLAICTPTLATAQIGGKITQQGSGGRSFQDRQPDLAYDPVNNYYAHVFMGGSPKHQIRLKLFDGTTGSGVQGGDTAMSTGTNDNINPRVAYIAKTGLFLVVWQEDNNGNWDIKCRAYDPTNKAPGAMATIANTTADEITPDIAGDSTKVDDDAVVVWDDETVGIRGVEVEVSAPTTVKVMTPMTLAPGPKPLHNNPSISRSGGSARRIVLAWEAVTSSMAVTAYTLDLVPASTGLTVGLSNSYPSVDGDGTDFVIVFQRPQPSNTKLGDIWALSVRIPPVATSPMIQTTAPKAIGALANDEKRPTIAYLGSSYLAAWAVVNTADAFGKVQLQTLQSDCTNCGTGWLVQYGNRQRWVEYTSVASHYNSDSTTNKRGARAMYDTGWFHTSSQTNRSILQKVTYEVVGGATSSVAQGCGAGGTVTIPEPFSFGESVTPTLTGAATNATSGLFLLATPTMNRFTCGTCTVLDTPFVFGISVSGGSSRFPARIPCDASLAGAEVDFQFVPFTPGSSPCNIAAGVSTSNILRAKVN